MSGKPSIFDLLLKSQRADKAASQGFDPTRPFYHTTKADIDQFDNDYTDIGTHIGTLDQATNRALDLNADIYGGGSHRSSGMFAEGANTIPLVTRAQNPLRMTDIGNWNNSADVLRQMPLDGTEWEDLFLEATDLRDQFEDVGDWIASPENRELLGAIRYQLQAEGYDSVVYRNMVETTTGPDAAQRAQIMALSAEQRMIMDKYKPERPPAPTLAEFGGDSEKLKAAIEQWLDWEPPKVGRLEMSWDDQKRLSELDGEIADLRNFQRDPDSLIVLDPDDLRHPNADFAAPGQEDLSKPGLLRMLAPTAVGGGMALGAMSPEQAQAAGAAQGATDLVQSILSPLEQFGRQMGGAVAALGSGEQEDLQRFEGQVIPPGEVGQEIGDAMANAIMDAAGWIGENTEDVGRWLMEQTTFRDRPLGEDIDMIVDWWKGQSDEDQTRMQAGGTLLANIADLAIPGPSARPGLDDLIRDPRYFKRPVEQRVARAEGLPAPEVEVTPRQLDVPEISVEDLEGREFVTSVSDRSRAGGEIVGVGGRELAVPVNLQGGQDFMFDTPNREQGILWASDKGPVTNILNVAKESKEATGENPIFVPWRMTPSGIDHATMAGDLMISNAATVLPKKRLKEVDEMIRGLTINGRPAGIPDWPGLGKPEEAMQAWANATGMQRKAIKDKVFDTVLRDETGLSRSDARLAVTDPSQFHAPEMHLQNVGIIDPDAGPGPQVHRTYGQSIFGTPLGRLKEDNLHILDLFPELQGRESPYRSASTRAMRGKFTKGLIDALIRQP